MITFDRVLPELLALCEEPVVAAGLKRCAVVRDVRGRVRLVVEPAPAAAPALAKLENDLGERLGKFFVPPLLATGAGNEMARIAGKLISVAKAWPAGWPRDATSLLGTKTPIDTETKWVGIDRALGKEAWLATTQPKKPWPLVRGKTPPIVTFHSFKGGVGRTTLVAAHALKLASGPASRRVAAIDLDLEAPGLGTLFDVRTERGVLDVLVDHLATDRIELDGVAAPIDLPADASGKLTIFPAGRIDERYLQKLARLDFTSVEPGAENPVGAALSALLKMLKSQFDVILLDARAGLHDLAGISLHGLAHVDVLVFRGTEQGLVGLEQTIRALGEMPDTELVLIEAQLPNDEAVFERQHRRSRERAYQALLDCVYPEEDPPQLEDRGAAHDVVPVRRKEWLDGLDSIASRMDDVLKDSELAAVSQRIDDACRIAADAKREEIA